MSTVAKKVIALIQSTHPLPCLAVALFSGLFSLSSGISLGHSLVISLAMLMQQFSVGLSNDWFDHRRDMAAGRSDKPTVKGLVTEAELRFWSLTAAVLAEITAVTLGLGAALWMVLMLAVGWAYNLGMKLNWTSAIPYALGFGSVPVFVGLSASEPFWVQPWVILVSALLGVSAHFANVLPDMADDKLTGVNALPHILGQRVSSLVIASTALAATLLVITQAESLHPLIALTGLLATLTSVGFASGLALRKKPPRVIFPLLILASLVNVILLVLGSAR
jgi:4-hydroxybenzoate polyprenyltransferase